MTIFHAARVRLGDLFERAAAVPAISVVLEQLNVIADEISVVEPDAEKAVLRTAARWVEELSESAALAHLNKADAVMLQEVATLVDSGVIAQRSADPHAFVEIFTKIEKQAANVYTRPYWRKPSLTLAKEIEHPRPSHAYLDPYAISATTATEPTAVVQLVLWPNRFGPPAYAVLPYIFVHECICHVPARQDRTDNTSIFAEGFMDWAAKFFYERWLTRVDSRLAPMARQHVSALQQVMGSSTRRTGHRRAEELIGWLSDPTQRRPVRRLVAPVKVAQLALLLNTTPGALDSKDHFVSELKRPFSPKLERRISAWAYEGASPAELLECTC